MLTSLEAGRLPPQRRFDGSAYEDYKAPCRARAQQIRLVCLLSLLSHMSHGENSCHGIACRVAIWLEDQYPSYRILYELPSLGSPMSFHVNLGECAAWSACRSSLSREAAGKARPVSPLSMAHSQHAAPWLLCIGTQGWLGPRGWFLNRVITFNDQTTIVLVGYLEFRYRAFY